MGGLSFIIFFSTRLSRSIYLFSNGKRASSRWFFACTKRAPSKESNYGRRFSLFLLVRQSILHSRTIGFVRPSSRTGFLRLPWHRTRRLPFSFSELHLMNGVEKAKKNI